MRKFFYICCFLLVGCSNNGSFEKGIHDFTPIIRYVNAQIDKGEWEFGLFHENSLSIEEINQQYDISLTTEDQVVVYTSISQAQISEIAFFSMDTQSEERVKQAIAYRKKQLHDRWDTYIMHAKDVIEKAQEGRIGKYYYFIVGIDAKNMVNYISND